ncbi:MAG: hypothetical protein OHK0017_03380 [Patescibacteria group bacterium]
MSNNEMTGLGSHPFEKPLNPDEELEVFANNFEIYQSLNLKVDNLIHDSLNSRVNFLNVARWKNAVKTLRLETKYLEVQMKPLISKVWEHVGSVSYPEYIKQKLNLTETKKYLFKVAQNREKFEASAYPYRDLSPLADYLSEVIEANCMACNEFQSKEWLNLQKQNDLCSTSDPEINIGYNEMCDNDYAAFVHEWRRLFLSVTNALLKTEDIVSLDKVTNRFLPRKKSLPNLHEYGRILAHLYDLGSSPMIQQILDNIQVQYNDVSILEILHLFHEALLKPAIEAVGQLPSKYQYLYYHRERANLVDQMENLKLLQPSPELDNIIITELNLLKSEVGELNIQIQRPVLNSKI